MEALYYALGVSAAILPFIWWLAGKVVDWEMGLEVRSEILRNGHRVERAASRCDRNRTVVPTSEAQHEDLQVGTEEEGVTRIEETFSAWKYEIREKKHSQIDRGVLHDVITGHKCPACKAVLLPLVHGQPAQCECGAQLMLYGAALKVIVWERP